MKGLLVVVVAALATAASCARGPEPTAADPGAEPLTLELPEGAARAAESIDVATLETVVRALSDDAMAGRGPASDGG